MRHREHPNSRNLGDDDDGETKMLLTLSVLVQMGSMKAQIKGTYWRLISDYIYIYIRYKMPSAERKLAPNVSSFNSN